MNVLAKPLHGANKANPVQAQAETHMENTYQDQVPSRSGK